MSAGVNVQTLQVELWLITCVMFVLITAHKIRAISYVCQVIRLFIYPQRRKQRQLRNSFCPKKKVVCRSAANYVWINQIFIFYCGIEFSKC